MLKHSIVSIFIVSTAATYIQITSLIQLVVIEQLETKGSEMSPTAVSKTNALRRKEGHKNYQYAIHVAIVLFLSMILTTASREANLSRMLSSILLSISPGSKEDDITHTRFPSMDPNSNNTLPQETYLYEGVEYKIPNEFTAPLEEYPDLLHISSTMREKFHPIVKEMVKAPRSANVKVLDLRNITGQTQLIQPEDQDEFEKNRQFQKKVSFLQSLSAKKSNFTIGKYDENRLNLYSSELFDDEDNAIDGFLGSRTVHIGIDLGGPIGTKVFSFWDGIVHSAGYNTPLGDYGHVVVIKYHLPDDNDDSDGATAADRTTRPFYCLYGHLDKNTVMMKKKWKAGDKVKRGELIGKMGDVRDNGGWVIPHVHLQLSIEAPKTHDMPGVVSRQQRPEGLVKYPDPRFVLGNIY